MSVRDAVLYDGEWSTIIQWLDELAGGRWSVPLGESPTIIRNRDGNLQIMTVNDDWATVVPGEWVIKEPNKNRFRRCTRSSMMMLYGKV